MGHVVVGVDGSPPAQAALAWAADHAHHRGLDLHVLTVYRASDDPNPHRVADGETGASHLQDQARLAADWRVEHDRYARTEAEQRASAMVDALDGPLPDTVLTRTATGRRPSEALLEAARDADLLVVGSRGRGGFAGLVLGSVTQQLSHHAPCPLVIVRPH